MDLHSVEFLKFILLKQIKLMDGKMLGEKFHTIIKTDGKQDYLIYVPILKKILQ